MKEFTYVITDAQGIHARPAGLFVKEAASCECDVKISKDGKGRCKEDTRCDGTRSQAGQRDRAQVRGTG